MRWKVRDAQRSFSALVQRALDEGPQIVTRQGEDIIVVLALANYESHARPLPPFNRFLLDGPSFDLELDRDREPTRAVEL